MEDHGLKTINDLKADKRKSSSKSNIQKALEKRKQILEEKRKNDALGNIKFNENYAITESSSEEEEFVKKPKKKPERQQSNVDDMIKREISGLMEVLKQHEAKLDKLDYKYKKQKAVGKVTKEQILQPSKIEKQ